MIIRKGKKTDLQTVLQLVMELAIYEKAPHEVDNSTEEMIADGFGKNPVFGFYVAEDKNQIIGMALYYLRYSTWKGKLLYLEDLIVTEKFRNKGVGSKLMDAVIHEASKLGCKGIQWQVLDWNEPAIRFYEKYKATYDKGWLNCRIMFSK